LRGFALERADDHPGRNDDDLGLLAEPARRGQAGGHQDMMVAGKTTTIDLA
jgi:hypothetical protein